MDEAKSPFSSTSSVANQADTMAVQDALVILATRMMGPEIRRNPSARQHMVALARSTPRFLNEDYSQTEARIRRFADLGGTAVMNGLFARALDILNNGYREEALQWAAVNAAVQQPTDEMNAMLHHLGKALGFSPAEVESRFKRALSHSADGTLPLK